MIDTAPETIGAQSGFGTGRNPPRSDGGIRSRLSLAGLPSIPQVLIRLLELFQSDMAGFREVAACIQQDVALTARVFSIASSASQHGSQKPASLDQCLTVLGMGTIKTIVINESIFQVFRRLASEKDYDLGRFWGHSLRCALIARALARASGQSDPSEAYLGGLLHDVGQLAMLTADPGGYLPIFLQQDAPGELCNREQAAFDVTHAEVGAWLIERWNLDSLLADSVLYHHDRIERLADAHPMIRCVHLADRLAFLHGDIRALAAMDLSGYRVPDGLDLPVLVEQTERELTEMATQLGIDTSTRIAGNELRRHVGDAGTRPVASGDQALAARVRDIVLLGNAFDESVPYAEGSAVLDEIIRALRIVFDIEATLAFLPQPGQAGRFVARGLAGDVDRHADRHAGIGFAVEASDAEIARSLRQGIRFVDPDGSGVPTVLDDQLVRMAGKPGVIYLPLRDGGACHGVLVAGVDRLQQNELRHGRRLCLEEFIGMAGRLFARRTRRSGGAAVGQENRLNHSTNDRRQLQQLVHEVGNPLAVIQNYLALLEHKFIERDIDRRELQIVSDEIERLSRLLKSAADDRQESGERKETTVNLRRLIEDMVDLCRPAASPFERKIDIVTELDAALSVMSSQRDALRQLVLNLLKNALEALSAEGGVIRVSTRPWANEKGPQFAEICIEDSGPGLAIVRQLVRELDGLINCRSSSQGTCFQILIPLSQNR